MYSITAIEHQVDQARGFKLGAVAVLADQQIGRAPDEGGSSHIGGFTAWSFHAGASERPHSSTGELSTSLG